MDRLTRYDAAGRPVSSRGYEVALARLAAYEDTGLTPEDVRFMRDFTPNAEFLLAKAEGRLVVLPCRMDAAVYDIRRFYKGRKIVRREIISGEIDHFTIGEAHKPIAAVCLKGNEWAEYEPKDLLLSREEAEEALRKKAGHEAEIRRKRNQLTTLPVL